MLPLVDVRIKFHENSKSGLKVIWKATRVQTERYCITSQIMLTKHGKYAKII
jgi:hypothetical protein